MTERVWYIESDAKIPLECNIALQAKSYAVEFQPLRTLSGVRYRFSDIHYRTHITLLGGRP
jgi:hypothetical protein